MADISFIKLFETVGSYYIFDVNTTSIIRIDEELYNSLNAFLTGRITWEQMDKEALDRIDKLKRQGFLKKCDLNTEIKHAAAEHLMDYLERNIHQLILQVTQNCNLRCKYCVYSGSYVNRVHTKKRMSVETAKKAVDFYHTHSGNLKTALISFYGGEPLLEMELIREIMAYADKVFSGKEIRYNMTTNATLLSDEIIEFLHNNDVSLTISLDGPQKV